MVCGVSRFSGSGGVCADLTINELNYRKAAGRGWFQYGHKRLSGTTDNKSVLQFLMPMLMMHIREVRMGMC